MCSLSVTVSIGVKLGRGIGLIAEKQIKYLLDAGMLGEQFSLDNVPVDLPSPFKDNWFDMNVALQIKECNIFHGWNNYCYWTIASLWGTDWAWGNATRTIVERGCPHVDWQNQTLRAEYKYLDIHTEPFHPFELEKMRREYDLADWVMVPSQFTKSTFPDSQQDKIFVLPPGVDTGKFKPNGLTSGHEKFTVLFVGGNWVRKGLIYLLRAWDRLDLPNSELRVVGCIPQDYFNSKVTGLGNISNEQLVKEYRNCDVFCLPSVDEGFGMVVLEALSCGKPVIITENVGAKDFVKQGYNGEIVKPRDIDGLAEAIRKMRDHPFKITRLPEWTWDRYGEKLIEFYKGLV